MPKPVSNWVMTDVLRVMSEQKVDVASFPISPARLAAMIGLIQDGTISGKIAKEVFEAMLTSPAEPRKIVRGTRTGAGLGRRRDHCDRGRGLERHMRRRCSSIWAGTSGCSGSSSARR